MQGVLRGECRESGLWGGQPCAGGCALGLQAPVRFGAACSLTVGAGPTACCWQDPCLLQSAGGQTWGPEPLWDDRRGAV